MTDPENLSNDLSPTLRNHRNLAKHNFFVLEFVSIQIFMLAFCCIQTFQAGFLLDLQMFCSNFTRLKIKETRKRGQASAESWAEEKFFSWVCFAK